MPIIRIKGGNYLLGTESKPVVIKGTTCVVRIGGGFENLLEYIKRYQQEELNKIDRAMTEHGKTYV